jgi:SAM-dependent methyltransferase
MGEEMPAATTDERRRSFDQMAQLYARARGAPQPALFDAVAVFVPPPADALEIGCGPGNASLPLLEHGFRIHAVELGENLAALARERLAAFPFTVEVSKFEDASLQAASDCSLDHWTSMITARLIYKHIRRRKFERRVFSALDAGLLARTRSTSRAAREATLRSTARRALAHLNAMDDGKASAFLLHDVYGYDLREIAEITDVSVAAAQARLVRGRREVHVRIVNDPELAYALDSTEAEV